MDEFKEFIESEVKLISAKTNPSGIAMIWKDSATTREDIDKLMSTLPSKLITFENYMYTIHRETWQIVFKRVISSLLSSYNSTARSITNSSIEDTNSIIEIRKYLASCLLEVIFSVIALGNSMDVSYPPEYIKSLEDKYSKGIPSIVMFMHSEQPRHAKIQEIWLPEKLNTPRARKYFSKAIEANIITKTDTGYSMGSAIKTKALLAYFLELVFCRNEAGKDNGIDFPDDDVSTLFRTTRLGKARSQYANNKGKKPRVPDAAYDGGKPTGYNIIDKIFM